METVETRNARITSAALTTADHGVLSGWLHLDYGGSGQGFGGHVLAVNPKSPHWPGAANYCGVWVTRVLQIADVSSWDQLAGKTIRVRASRARVHAIGHILREDWFDPEAELGALGAERPS